jgi:DNA-binding MarR family transcriptional regulator
MKGVSTINENKNINAEKLMNAFSQFRKIHWRPKHVSELKPSEFMVLHTVKHTYMEKGTGLKISEISDELCVAVPTVTQLVKSLERKGYVEKIPDEDDGRVTRVILSGKGRDLARKGYEDFYRRFAGLADYLGDDKSGELASLLLDVIEYFTTVKTD